MFKNKSKSQMIDIVIDERNKHQFARKLKNYYTIVEFEDTYTKHSSPLKLKNENFDTYSRVYQGVFFNIGTEDSIHLIPLRHIKCAYQELEEVWEPLGDLLQWRKYVSLSKYRPVE